MLTEQMLKNAHDMALEEIIEPEHVTTSDFRDYRKRLNNLLDKLETEIEEEVDE